MPVSVGFRTKPAAKKDTTEMIYVRARPGRIVPFEGRIIPGDRFIPVTETFYIRRRISDEDLEVEAKAPPQQARRAPPPAPKAD
jgi:hypothetical protein